MASWTEPPNTPECRSFSQQFTLKDENKLLWWCAASKRNFAECRITDVLLHHSIFVGPQFNRLFLKVKHCINRTPPQWRSSRFLSDHRWCRVWSCPASSCQRCKRSPRLLRRCLFEITLAHPGPQIQTPPSPRSRTWYWWEAPGKWREINLTVQISLYIINRWLSC